MLKKLNLEALKKLKTYFLHQEYTAPIILSFLCSLFVYQNILKPSSSEHLNIPTLEILTSTQKISVGEKISSEHISFQSIPKNLLPIGAVLRSDTQRILGKKVYTSMQIGEIFLWHSIESKTSQTSSMKIKKGYRSISIPVDSLMSSGYRIQVGDFIDLIHSTNFKNDSFPSTYVLLQKVPVISTGDIASPHGASYESLGLMVLPKDVNVIINAMQQGQLALSLRNPKDLNKSQKIPIISRKALHKAALKSSRSGQRKGPVEVIQGQSTED